MRKAAKGRWFSELNQNWISGERSALIAISIDTIRSPF